MYSSQIHVQQSNHPPIPNAHAHHAPPPPQQNGHHHHHPPQPGTHRPAVQQTPKEPLRVLGIPSIAISGGQLIYGDSQSNSERVYTPIKVVGDGSFGTVWLVDWHSTLPPNTPLSPMQCGAGARPEWAGKRLVALKRMKKRWDGGWDECKKLKELESLRAIPFHPNIIPLYDFFLLPSTKELYFVFESMEGNLYQLIKSRKGRPLAGGLVSCIFRQVVSGLEHIHANGYFHRDMKPENLLVTTTGLYDYRNVSPVAPPNAPPEKDVVVIVKLADFGLARETRSKPPYTEYVSTRWYRAPEVLLRSRDYSNPVDLWALGTIMAELINLKPLFPGGTEVDQVARICEILGDPSDEYGVDARGSSIGGGKWVRGTRMARSVGYTFPKIKPVPIHNLFDRNVPHSMVECIADLLKYDPDVRLTCRQLLDHSYIMETTPGNVPPGPQIPMQLNASLSHMMNGKPMQQRPPTVSPATSMNSIAPRTVPPSHSDSPSNAKPVFNGPRPPLPEPIPPHVQPHRIPFYPRLAADQGGQQGAPSRLVAPSPDGTDALHVYSDISHSTDGAAAVSAVASSVYSTGADRIADGWPTGHVQPYAPNEHDSNRQWVGMEFSSPPPPERPPQSSGQCQPMDYTLTSPMAPEDPSKPMSGQEQGVPMSAVQPSSSASSSKLKLGLGFGRKSSKWGLSGMFGHGDKQHHVLPPVDENAVASAMSTPSLKRTQSSSTDSRSLSEVSPVENIVVEPPQLPPMDAKARKKEAERIAKEAEMQRRKLAANRIREQSRAVMQKRSQMNELKHGTDFDWESAAPVNYLGVQKKVKQRSNVAQASSSSATINAAGGRFRGSNEGKEGTEYDNSRDFDHRTKARRRDFDDDHSMSSSEVQSVGRLSVISFATVESDPGSSRLRHRPSLFGITRMQSNSSLQNSFDDFSSSAQSSNSPSFEQQLVSDFDSRASMSSYEAARSSISSTSSPPPIHSLSLSSPQQHAQMLGGRQTYITLPPLPMAHQHLRVPTPNSPYEYTQYGIQQQPPSPAIAPHPSSNINPMFKVPLPPHQGDGHSAPHQNTLPPFSQLASIAEPLPLLGRTEESH